MALIGDSGAIYALYDADDAHHDSVRRALEAEPGPLILPAPTLTEIDYLLRGFLGVAAELDFLDSLVQGAFVVEPLTVEDLVRCRELVQQYRDLDLGLADASVAATAERLGVFRLLTVDERDFRAIRPRGRSHFTLLPADA